MKTGARIRPEDYILSAISPEDRLEASLKIARETFRNTTLTMKDIEKAIKKLRRKADEKTK